LSNFSEAIENFENKPNINEDVIHTNISENIEIIVEKFKSGLSRAKAKQLDSVLLLIKENVSRKNTEFENVPIEVNKFSGKLQNDLTNIYQRISSNLNSIGTKIKKLRS